MSGFVLVSCRFKKVEQGSCFLHDDFVIVNHSEFLSEEQIINIGLRCGLHLDSRL